MDQLTDTHATNPLLISEGLPRFDLIQPEHVVLAARLVFEQTEKR